MSKLYPFILWGRKDNTPADLLVRQEHIISIETTKTKHKCILTLTNGSKYKIKETSLWGTFTDLNKT